MAERKTTHDDPPRRQDDGQAPLPDPFPPAPAASDGDDDAPKTKIAIALALLCIPVIYWLVNRPPPAPVVPLPTMAASPELDEVECYATCAAGCTEVAVDRKALEVQPMTQCLDACKDKCKPQRTAAECSSHCDGRCAGAGDDMARARCHTHCMSECL